MPARTILLVEADAAAADSITNTLGRLGYSKHNMTQEIQRGLVNPVQVIDDQEQRMLTSQPDKDAGHCQKQP